MDLKLQHRRALICGGSSGLGRAVATALVAEGVHVILLSRHAASLSEAAEALNAMGPGRAGFLFLVKGLGGTPSASAPPPGTASARSSPARRAPRGATGEWSTPPRRARTRRARIH